MASFALSATTGGARKHAWTKTRSGQCRFTLSSSFFIKGESGIIQVLVSAMMRSEPSGPSLDTQNSLHEMKLNEKGFSTTT